MWYADSGALVVWARNRDFFPRTCGWFGALGGHETKYDRCNSSCRVYSDGRYSYDSFATRYASRVTTCRVSASWFKHWLDNEQLSVVSVPTSVGYITTAALPILYLLV